MHVEMITAGGGSESPKVRPRRTRSIHPSHRPLAGAGPSDVPERRTRGAAGAASVVWTSGLGRVGIINCITGPFSNPEFVSFSLKLSKSAVHNDVSLRDLFNVDNSQVPSDIYSVSTPDVGECATLQAILRFRTR